MLKQTPLYALHHQSGAKLVDFAGWQMPIYYESQIQEHHCVRQDVGMFDVSHMGVLDVEGDQATEFLRDALANDVAKLTTPNRALYTCMLNEAAGVIDDLIVYRLGECFYRIVLNASRREKDTAWLQSVAERFEVTLMPKPSLCILAVQGPNAVSNVIDVLGSSWVDLGALKPFHVMKQGDVQVARTGYTGEDGVEIILPDHAAISLWQQLLDSGVKPCGLGARDTLRLEAGLNLYGVDMDETTTPLEVNLGWTVCFKDPLRDFIGRTALLQQQQQGLTHTLVALVMEQKGVLRNHQTVCIDQDGEGCITSGSFSPTLGHALAFARVPNQPIEQAFVERRGQRIPVRVVKAPFVRHGKKVFK
jgi:aminomethyltransferase